MRPGQLLVEVILALGIAVVAMLALVMVATRSVSSSGLAKRQSQATGLANKAIEQIRYQKQTMGWDEFKASYSGTKCFDGTSITGTGECAVAGTEYKSTVNFTYISVTPPPSGTVIEKLSVMVNIYWFEGDTRTEINQGQIFSRY